MSFFLDTNICIYALKGSFQVIGEKILSITPDEIKISSVVKAELFLGAKKSRNPEKTFAVIKQFLSPFEIIPFGSTEAEIYAEIRAKLELAGKIIGPNDLIIASTVLSHRGVLVTHNTKEFKRIPGLKFEDWVSAK